ncbi:InlB B-repeat-containing protein [Gemelliphila palaticanis]|uniref:InlB B-repeat-containing protein n=1 Tax=Gemelliphila palaticanis TaxID=81950 RepID=A0ABX2T0I7_9BACL|nr:InlB B-repeat-containing protein [Gemella palaticanis]MBF0716149.1 InlB B-repeat-containing protein [Gemella palaticanis]NYS48079.1 InlB B-repeat-containing protein [Gemella palaticanis]
MKKKNIFKSIFCSVMVLNATSSGLANAEENTNSGDSEVITNTNESTNSLEEAVAANSTVNSESEENSSNENNITGSSNSSNLNYEGAVTFVTRNGNQTVHFTNSSEEIQKTDDEGNIANQGDAGGGISKSYFIGWSNVPNYDGSQEDSKVFYGHEAISRAFPEGLKGGEKLYAFYLTANSAMSFSNRLAGDLKINKNIDDLSTMFKKFELANEDNQNSSTYYVNNDLGDTSLVNLGANFHLNPYITTAIRRSSYYHHPGNLDYGASPKDDFILNPLNLNNLKEKIKDLENKYTYVDLHVKLDSRINVADKLNFAFKSYAFRPIAILRGDYSALMESEIVTPNEDPNSKIILTTNGEKEFIVRTRIRTKWDIPNATAEEAIKDMELISNSDKNFSISKENLLRIARGGSDPIEINGHIQGGANLYSVNMFGITFGGPTDIEKQEANAKILNFKPAYVVFNLNSPFKADAEQNLGRSRVALNGSLDNDIFDMREKPKYSTVPAENIVGEAMPDAPRIEDYNFEGYNTMADGSGTSFDGNTLVDKSMLTNGEVTVYAQWSTNVMFNKNSSSLDDTADQNLASLAVKYNGNLNNDILRGGTVPTTTLEGYTFKEWNTKADGTGETLDLSRGVVRPVTYFAVWEQNRITKVPKNPPVAEDKPSVEFKNPDNYPTVDKPSVEFKNPDNYPTVDKPSVEFKNPDNYPTIDKPSVEFKNPPVAEDKPSAKIKLSEPISGIEIKEEQELQTKEKAKKILTKTGLTNQSLGLGAVSLAILILLARKRKLK